MFAHKKSIADNSNNSQSMCLAFIFRLNASLFIFFVIVEISLYGPVNTRKAHRASRATIKRIKQLINEKAEREVVQDDAAFLAQDAPIFNTNRNAKPHHDELKVNNPEEYYQGDVDLSAWQADRLQKELMGQDEHCDSKKRKKRKIGKEPLYKRWDKRRPINFDFAANIPPETRTKIRQALDIWQQGTCLRFHEGGPDVDRLEFFDGGGCSSFVGKVGGTQGISITTPGCDHVGIISHEVGHALALFHEQARPDQQDNINIHYYNIPVSRWNNFHPVSDNQASTFELPYDTGSVMHYGAFGFSSDPYRPTISTIDRNFQSTIGQRAAPSFLDVQSINEAYKCHERCLFPLVCSHGGYQNPNNCSTCTCPTGFQGQTCDDVETTTCGQTVHVSTNPAYISSPNFPNFFLQGQKCVWLFKAPPTGKIFLEFVESFHYQCEDTCDKSFVEIKTGPDFRRTGYRFCCAVLPNQVFQSAEDEMIVMHFANDQITGGFKAKIWSDKEEVRPIIPTVPAVIENIVTTTQSPETTTEEPIEQEIIEKVETIPTLATTRDPELITERPIFGLVPEVTTVPPLPYWPFGSSVHPLFTSTPISLFTLPGITPLPGEVNTGIAAIATPVPSLLVTSDQKCSCTEWTSWTDCSQVCGGCGKRSRKRECQSTENCQTEEKRTCNFAACPQGTNFLFNNGEFHILWKSCCVGLFKNKEECTGLNNGENPFLKIISSLLSAQDAKNNVTLARILRAKNNNASRLETAHLEEH